MVDTTGSLRFLRRLRDHDVAVDDLLGVPVDDRTVDAMRAYLDEHPQGAHGAHRYSFDDLHLDPADARARFARYQAFFGVANEG